MRALRSVGAAHLRRYHRHEIAAGGRLPDEPVLFVANHGFGGIGDLNVAATFAALERVAPDRAVTTLTHQLAWTLGTGKLVEAAGARPAGRASAIEAFERGESVLVFPGGRHRGEQVVRGPEPDRVRGAARVRPARRRQRACRSCRS